MVSSSLQYRQHHDCVYDWVANTNGGVQCDYVRKQWGGVDKHVDYVRYYYPTVRDPEGNIIKNKKCLKYLGAQIAADASMDSELNKKL